MSNAMKSSKFKPATGGLPSFSTAGFRKPRPSGSSETIDISNDSGSSPSLKRTSSDSSDPQPPTKRRKSDKENHFDLQPASSIVKGKARALDEHPPSPPIPTEFADLQSKSAVQLQEMLLANHEYNRHNMELIYNYHSHRHGELTSEDSKADFFTLESIKSLLDSRISAIKKALQRREQVRTRSPSPRRPALSISTRSPSPRRPAPSISTSISRSTVSRQDTISVTSGAMPLLASTSANTTRIERQPTLPSNTIDIDDEDELWADVNEVTMEDLRDSDIARQESVTSPYTKEIMQNLQVFGIPKFRTNQSEAIHATMAGRDVFVLMPTGGGKSLCYQLPAICRGGKTKGVTVVISPLLSLMSDQVQGLRDKGISAESLTSDTSEDDVKAIRARFYSNTKPSLLYVAPERLQISSSLQNMLGNLHRQKELARFVIDEAHCISTWGQDFREAYQDLHKLREQYPDVPIMALTATADHRTRDDILARLNLKDPVVFTQSFDRPNLFYRIVPKATIEELIKYIKESHPGQSGIIYRRSRDGCEKLAQQLRNKGLKAKHFHAGLDKTEKDATQNEWKRNPGHIIVATIAFGMGIDKADVRFVIHYDLPKSMDGYYQETGRAGRDQLPAECILHYCYRDVQPFRTMIRNNKDKMATRESIARQEEALNVVVRYCQNNTICRRTQILQHFGEQFDETECKGRCNNCAEKGTRVHQDITDDARTVLSLVQTLELGKENVTLDHCRHIFKGSNLAAIREKQHDKLSAFGRRTWYRQ
ncbi:DNA helicase [Mycena amicta]|nr:DNA helicase [Mycena amicta]